MNPRILIFGADGQLARALRQVEPSAYFIPSSECNFEYPEQIRAVLDRVRPQIVLNPAAYTAVDMAESEPEKAHRINGVAPGVIGEWCAANSASLIHFSTDYVFSGAGQDAWLENDVTAPLNVYGSTKLEGEKAVVASKCHHIIIRTSWVYSPYGNNFVGTMIKLGRTIEEIRVVDDQVGSPTLASDIAGVTKSIYLSPRFQEANGIFHLTNEGAVSWYGFACEIFEILRRLGVPLKVCKVIAIPTEDFPRPAKRPKNSRLSLAKIESVFSVSMRPWQEAARDCILQIVASEKYDEVVRSL